MLSVLNRNNTKARVQPLAFVLYSICLHLCPPNTEDDYYKFKLLVDGNDLNTMVNRQKIYPNSCIRSYITIAIALAPYSLGCTSVVECQKQYGHSPLSTRSSSL